MLSGTWDQVTLGNLLSYALTIVVGGVVTYLQSRHINITKQMIGTLFICMGKELSAATPAPATSTSSSTETTTTTSVVEKKG